MSTSPVKNLKLGRAREVGWMQSELPGSVVGAFLAVNHTAVPLCLLLLLPADHGYRKRYPGEVVPSLQRAH